MPMAGVLRQFHSAGAVGQRRLLLVHAFPPGGCGRAPGMGGAPRGPAMKLIWMAARLQVAALVALVGAECVVANAPHRVLAVHAALVLGQSETVVDEGALAVAGQPGLPGED